MPHIFPPLVIYFGEDEKTQGVERSKCAWYILRLTSHPLQAPVLHLWQAIQIRLEVPLGSSRKKTLPLVALVMHIHLKHFTRESRLDHFILLQSFECLP